MPARYVSPHPKPTPREAEVLTIISEECAEITLEICKAKRFGLKDGYPGTNRTNRERISEELGDLFAIVDLAIEEGIVSKDLIEYQKPRKRAKLLQFMQTDKQSLME